MRRRVHWQTAVLVPATLYLGCGITGSEDALPGANSGENSPSAPNADEFGGDDPQPVVIPVAGGGSQSDDDGVGDPFGDGLSDGSLGDNPGTGDFVIGPPQFVNFLAFLNDSFVTQLLEGTPSNGFAASTTYLQRLCEQGDTPDYVCQDLYGN